MTLSILQELNFHLLGGHIDSLKSKGMPVSDNSELTKVTQTNGAIEVSLG